MTIFNSIKFIYFALNMLWVFTSFFERHDKLIARKKVYHKVAVSNISRWQIVDIVSLGRRSWVVRVGIYPSSFWWIKGIKSNILIVNRSFFSQPYFDCFLHLKSGCKFKQTRLKSLSVSVSETKTVVLWGYLVIHSTYYNQYFWINKCNEETFFWISKQKTT